MFDFRFNTPTPFPESGSRKHFYALGMRGIDFSHKITPRKVIFAKIKKNFFSKVLLQSLPPLKNNIAIVFPIAENSLQQFQSVVQHNRLKLLYNTTVYNSIKLLYNTTQQFITVSICCTTQQI